MAGPSELERGADVENPQSTLNAIPEFSETSSTHSGDSNEQVVPDSAVSDALENDAITECNARDRANSAVGTAQDVEQVAQGGRQRRRSGQNQASAVKRCGMSWRFKLPDNRYRPPETEEEWNAFYQE
mgnify:CR=1 FL=1